MAYTVQIRKALNDKGISNDQISYDNTSGFVKVGGQNFMRPAKTFNGTSFGDQAGFNNAWNNYSNTLKNATGIPSGMMNIGATAPNLSRNASAAPAASPVATSNTYNPYASAGTQNPYNSQISGLIAQLQGLATQPQNVDPYSTAQYAAYKAQADKGAQASIRAAQESLGSSGFGRSTALSERSQGIQNDANTYLETQVVPTIIAQQQAQRQQEFASLMATLDPLLNQQGRADNLVQQDFSNNLAVTDRTGTYMPQGAQDTINQLLALKSQAEQKGITADQRAGLSQQADALRAQLTSLGIDATKYGSGVTAAQAAALPMGMRTLAGQQMDLDSKNANLNAALQVGQQTGKLVNPQSDYTGLFRQAANPNTPLNMAGEQQAYQKARDAITDQQWQAQFDQSTKQFGLNYALQQLQENNQTAYQQAQLALSADDNARQWAQFEQGSQEAPVKEKYLASTDVAKTAQKYMTNTGKDKNFKEYQYIPENKRTSQGTNAIVDLFNAGYDRDSIDRVLSSMKLTDAQKAEAWKAAAGGK